MKMAKSKVQTPNSLSPIFMSLKPKFAIRNRKETFSMQMEWSFYLSHFFPDSDLNLKSIERCALLAIVFAVHSGLTFFVLLLDDIGTATTVIF
jgi:hypothetical protein